MADTYAILGFASDLESPVILYESGSYLDCELFQSKYTRWGDWGGYEALALYEIAPNEPVETIHETDAPIIVWDKESI
jgi:hypothetical protein